MASIFTISDNESDNSEEMADKDTSKPKKEAASSEFGNLLTVPTKFPGEQTPGRHRLLSLTDASNMSEEDSMDEEGQFRGRSRSAPPSLWAAKKYGRQLRRMSDEFDSLKDKGMKRVQSAGAARQVRPSPSFFAFLWSHQESDTETSNSLTHSDTRPAE